MDMPMGAAIDVAADDEVRPAKVRSQVFQRADLIRAILGACTVIERRNTIPVLETVLITIQDDRIVARATNLDQEVTLDLGEAPQRGAISHCLMSPHAVAGLLKGMTGDHVSLLPTDGGKIAMSGQDFTAKISTLPAIDFPRISQGPEGWATDIPASVLDLMIRVSGAMSREETRYYLNGLHIGHLRDWTYRISATDGHRLYFADVEWPGEQKLPNGGIIIPRHAVEKMARYRDRKSDQPVRLSAHAAAATNNFIDWAGSGAPSAKLQFGATVLKTKLIDGTFPDISRVIPDAGGSTCSFRAATADLRRAIRALAFGATEKSPAIRLSLGDGKLRIGAKFAIDGVDAEYSIEAKTTGHLEMGFNGHYLLAVLDAMHTDEVVFLLRDQSAPALIVDPTGEGMRAVLMPMRL